MIMANCFCFLNLLLVVLVLCTLQVDGTYFNTYRQRSKLSYSAI